MVSVSDSLGGITNVTSTIQVSPPQNPLSYQLEII